MTAGFDRLQTGVVIRYPYLWSRQARVGETEGRKDRPVVVAIRLARSTGDRVFLLAITSSPPPPGHPSTEIPDREKVRAGLSREKRLWIMIDEANIDTVGRSFYLVPQTPLGRFSDRFFLPVLHQIVANRTIKTTERSI